MQSRLSDRSRQKLAAMEETALQQSVPQLEVIVPQVEMISDTAQEKVCNITQLQATIFCVK